MKTSCSIAFFAAIAVLFSSFTANAQTNSGTVFEFSEQWLEAAQGIPGSTVVSGIFPEESEPFIFEEDFFDTDTPITFQALLARPEPFSDEVLSVVTFPWGGITNEQGVYDFDVLIGEVDGTVAIDFAALPETVAFNTLENVLNFRGLAGVTLITTGVGGEVLTLTPDADLGTAIGFSLVQPVRVNPLDNLTYNIFDGDTLLASLSFDTAFTDPDDPTMLSTNSQEGFIVPRGAQITRVEVVLGFEQYNLAEDEAFASTGNASNIQFLFGDPDAIPVDVPAETTCQESLANIATDIAALATNVGDDGSRRCVEIAADLIEYAADDIFFEEDGERLSVNGGSLFTYSAYAIFYLKASGAEGTDELVDQILAKLDAIVDSEIAFAIANDGDTRLIDRAEDLVDIAQFIDEDLGNEVVATIAYKLAWLNAYCATYY